MKRFHVIFQKADDIKWWMKGLEREMSHVWVMEETLMGGYACLIRVENLHNMIDTSAHMYEFKDFKELMDLQDIPYKGLTINLDVDPLIPFSPFNILSCVSVTRKMMGINKPLIVTPKQLYRHLLNIGAKEI
jgi:hypothetical protein